jgi:hypothetical protein
MSGVPLHDVWAVDLNKPRSGITLEAFLRRSKGQPFKLSPAVRALLAIRFFIGGIFGWDRTQAGITATFADRLTPQDRAQTLVAPGSKDGPFSIVYRFENEQLSELVNQTAHAAALSALVENQNGYRYYFAVYVRNVGRLTPFYMTLIDPFRKLVVYPSLLRSVRTRWERALAEN